MHDYLVNKTFCYIFAHPITLPSLIPKPNNSLCPPPFFSQEKFNTQWAILQMNRSQIKRGTDKKKKLERKTSLKCLISNQSPWVLVDKQDTIPAT